MQQHQRRVLLALLVAVTVVVSGCRSSEEPDPDPEESVEEVEEQESASAEAKPRDVFGLPLPPEYIAIRKEEYRARVTTKMSLEDLEAFFDSRLSEHETLLTNRNLEIVPLRPHLPRASASRFGGRRSNVIVTYLMPADISEIQARPPISDDEPQQGDRVIIAGRDAEDPRPGQRPQIGERPDWLDDLQGQPVNLRTDDGELLAPGARWGEPYIPPEGSPLHTRGNEPNFGRPFGDWRAR